MSDKKIEHDKKDAQGKTALIHATSEGNSDQVRKLLADGASPNIQGANQWNALMLALSLIHI